MKKSIVFLILGIIMLVVAVGFVIYALLHPASSWGIPSAAVDIIYISYIICNILLFVLFVIFHIKKK